MVKRLVTCPCGKEHWVKVTKEKNPLTGKTMKFVLESDKLCQSCKNMIRRRGMKKKARLREIPKEFYKDLTLRELYQSEMDRRKKEDVDRNKLRKKK